MDILGYEIDIYVVIVVLAGIMVLSIMLLIGNSMKGKKPSSKNRKVERNQRDKRDKLPEISPDNNEAKPPHPEKLLPSPANKLPEELPKPSISKTSNEIPGFPVEMANAEKSAATGADTEKKITADTEMTKNIPAGPDAEKNTAPVARPWDTEATQSVKEVSKEEAEENEKGGGLLDVFDEEDVEDTGLAELAGLLADIDVETLKKLSSEVSQVLASRETGN